MPTLIAFLLFSFSIVQQPAANTLWVSPTQVTYFARVPDGNIGLLAESNPAFLELQTGDILTLGNLNSVSYYRVVNIRRVTATDPLSPFSNFFDIDSGLRFTSLELGDLVYAGSPRRLVLQTCIDGASGRIFITALPLGRMD
jgi:hypothetical protein